MIVGSTRGVCVGGGSKVLVQINAGWSSSSTSSSPDVVSVSSHGRGAD